MPTKVIAIIHDDPSMTWVPGTDGSVRRTVALMAFSVLVMAVAMSRLGWILPQWYPAVVSEKSLVIAKVFGYLLPAGFGRLGAAEACPWRLA